MVPVVLPPTQKMSKISLCACLLYEVVLVRVSNATTKHPEQKASWGGKDLFSLHFHIAAAQQRKSGEELKQSRTLGQKRMQRLWRGVAY